MSSTKIWLVDATEKLQHAEAIGARADAILTATKGIIKANNAVMMRSNFLLDAANQQIQLLALIHSSIKLQINDREREIYALEDMLESSIRELLNMFDMLKSINVESTLTRDESTLYDFISEESLESLTRCKGELKNVKEEYSSGLEEEHRSLQLKIHSFTADLNSTEKQLSEVSRESWIEECLQENNSLEVEIATLIESLANHYDQCLKGANAEDGKIESMSENDKKELFAVLSKDYQEVPNVLSDLEEAFSDIEQRCSRISTFLSSRPSELQLKKLLNKMILFGKKDLTKTQEMLNRQKSNLNVTTLSINEKCEESKQLVLHYKQFIKSYYTLILEVERRQNMQNTMQKLLADTNKRLDLLQMEDFKQQEDFRKINGPFLPSDIWQDFNDESPLVQLSVKFLELPKMSKEGLFAAKGHLDPTL